MFFYAITVNRTHKAFYGLDIEEPDMFNMVQSVQGTVENIVSNFKNIEYIDIVLHKNDLVDYHYHALLITNAEITIELAKGWFHLETVINLPKYEKYMHNHDKKVSHKYGDMPYFDSESYKENAINEMLNYMYQSRSALKT